MKRTLFSFLVAVIMAISTLAQAGEPVAKPVLGKVYAVADGSITITNKKTGDQTFKIDATTKFAKSDGSQIALADIKAGNVVRVKPAATPDVAAKITTIERKKKEASD